MQSENVLKQHLKTSNHHHKLIRAHNNHGCYSKVN